jgi:hypothetical protein
MAEADREVVYQVEGTYLEQRTIDIVLDEIVCNVVP